MNKLEGQLKSIQMPTYSSVVANESSVSSKNIKLITYQAIKARPIVLKLLIFIVLLAS